MFNNKHGKKYMKECLEDFWDVCGGVVTNIIKGFRIKA